MFRDIEMTIETNDLIRLVIELMGEHSVQVTARQSMKGALITGTCSFIGGLMAGPPGLAIGGASGGLLSAWYTKGTFKSVREALNDLPYERKRQIAAQIQEIVNKLEIDDLAELVRLAVVVHSLTQPNHILVQKLIEESLPIIQRHIQM